MYCVLLGTVWIMACKNRNLEFYCSFDVHIELFNICNFGGKEDFSFCQFHKSTGKPLMAIIMKIITCLRIKLGSRIT